jgi:hypothetical protein
VRAVTKRESKAEEETGGERRPFLLRISPQLMDELRSWAGQELRSLNGHIEWVLREAVKQRANAKSGKAKR